jgi:bifunctional DNA-binding transcriptional regulator/antitoxin component of YhaV-PrlF toxin-antitoxin module
MLNNNETIADIALLIGCNPIELLGEIQKRYYYSKSKKHWFSLHEIVTQRLNKRESFKDVAKDIGFESSTFRKRVEKEYCWSSADKCFVPKMYREEFGLEEFDVLRTSADCLEETQILIMERYKDKDHWKEEEYNCFGEKCIKEECILIEHLDKELTEDAEKLGISKSELIQLYLLRYLSKNRKRKGSGLKFERGYKKTTQEIHEDIMTMGVEQYRRRQWPKLLENEEN